MSHFKLALNTSTLFPFKLDVFEQVRVVADAGYDGIELWVKDIEAYLKTGGSIKELRKFIEDQGIEVVNGIAFFKWSDIDEPTRQAGLRQAEKEMLMLRDLGCRAVAAPPTGNVAHLSLETMASHFAELTALAQSLGVEPYLEFWGRAQKLSKLSEAIYLAVESELTDVKVLLDPFHMYTGGSQVEGLSYLKSEHIGIVHVNDYPASPAQTDIQDSDRVYPGDGIAPSKAIKDFLIRSGYGGYLSLELFIENYGDKTAQLVAADGLEKMKRTYL